MKTAGPYTPFIGQTLNARGHGRLRLMPRGRDHRQHPRPRFGRARRGGMPRHVGAVRASSAASVVPGCSQGQAGALLW